MEMELINFFKEHGVSIQITLDINHAPTVHAFIGNNKKDLYRTEGITLSHALALMKEKYCELMNNK